MAGEQGRAADAAHDRSREGGQEDAGMQVSEAVRTTPTAPELERAIVSVPGVADAAVHRDEATGRSRLRLRLAPGEDADSVSWSVAATLRERFGIALDPDAIRPVSTGSGEDAPEVAVGSPTDPVHLVDDDAPAADEEREERSDPHASAPRSTRSVELLATRERLTAAATEALRAAGELEAPLAVAAVVTTDPTAPSVDDPTAAGSEDAPATSAPSADAPASAGSEDAPAAAGSEDTAATSAPSEDDPAVDPPVEAPTAPPAPRTAEPASGPERVRAAIRHLDTRRDDTDVRVTATLELDGRFGHGRAIAIPTMHGTLRAVAEATVSALREVVDERMLIGIDRVTLHPSMDASIATVVVTLLTDRGEETLLGGSIVRGDPERAVMRATLDALNRRVASVHAS